MSTPVLLEDFAAELVRRGLPVDYAQNTAAELADHHRDLTEELRATGLSELEAEIAASERLGELRVLVKKSIREFQRRHWCARWPLVTFLLAPIPLWIIAYIAVAYVMIGVNWSLGCVGIIESNPIHVAFSNAPRWLKCSVDVLLWVGIPALLTVGLARLAKRAALGWQWVALAACVMAISAGSVRKEAITPVDSQTFAAAVDTRYRVWVSLPLIEPSWWHNTGWQRLYGGHPVQAFQFFGPLAAAGIFLFRARQLARHSEQVAFDGDYFQGGKHEHARVA